MLCHMYIAMGGFSIMAENTNAQNELQRDIDGLRALIQQFNRMYIAVAVLLVLAALNLIHWVASLALVLLAAGLAYFIYSRTSKLRAQQAEKQKHAKQR